MCKLLLITLALGLLLPLTAAGQTPFTGEGIAQENLVSQNAAIVATCAADFSAESLTKLAVLLRINTKGPGALDFAKADAFGQDYFTVSCADGCTSPAQQLWVCAALASSGNLPF